jgi:hypothetical protein
MQPQNEAGHTSAPDHVDRFIEDSSCINRGVHTRSQALVTSNLPFEDRTSVIGSERLSGALLDRLTHHVHILELNGHNYRLKQSKSRRRKTPAPASDDASPSETMALSELGIGQFRHQLVQPPQKFPMLHRALLSHQNGRDLRQWRLNLRRTRTDQCRKDPAP